MAARANWKGFLKVAELVCPVALYTAASTSDRIAFHMLNRATGNRLHREFIDSETGKPVERDDQVKGYATGDNDYIMLDPDEIAAALPNSDKTMNVDAFIACGDIDDLYFDKPYYLAPSDRHGQEAFALIRDGMKSRKVAALAQTVLFRRVRTVLIRPHGDGLIASTLNYDYEVRSAEKTFADVPDIKLKGEMLELAEHIIKTKSGRFDPSKFDDRYDAALAEVVKAKIEGRKIKPVKPKAEGKVIDLMEALRQSAGGKADKTAKTGTKKAAPKRKAGGAPAKGRLSMAGLDVYRQKRDFKTTAEPKGRKARGRGDSFVIQKHDATRLHYDFRLEMDGVLKSWAVTRGPSLVPSEKRLAVHVEDHPLDYGDFEGTIPKGEYGGGTVIVWDRGTWKPLGDAAKAYAKGHLEFELDGEKLHGRWHLVRMHGKPGEKRENWLLMKGDDEFALPEGSDDILDERPESVKTGRQISDVAGEAPGWSSKTGAIKKSAKKKVAKPQAAAPEVKDVTAPDPSGIDGAKKAKLPDFLPPMLATLAAAPPAGDQWLHEIKFDGYRLQARIEAGRVKMLTRSGLDWTKKFGKRVIAALADLPVGTAIIDGELVVESSAGASDFSALQSDLSDGRDDRFIFYVFDLLYLDGYDLTRLPLEERKAMLSALLPATEGILRYSGHFDENGALVLRHACRLSLEGVVSKMRDAPYRGGRSKAWIKSKCSARQEFVVGGFVPSTVSRQTIGSLVLGVYKNGKLEPVGRVGTGFTASVAADLFKKLSRLRTDESSFGRRLTSEEGRQVRYVRPDLVAEVEFRAWTADGHLRHASFRGLREDKPASEVIAEMPTKSKAAPKADKPPRRTVRLTHPDRVYWPDDGVTKEGLADYYTEVWRYIAPHIVGRPLALLRAPSGINGQTFFQKHAWKGINSNILLVQDPAEKDDEPYVAVNDLDGLLGLVQSATLEIHPWGSTLADWERPDRIIMDLDPGDGVEWPAVIEAAEETRKRLEAAGLNAFLKTSGGKGLHVVAPLKPSADWPAVKAFCKGMADAMAKDDPEKYVSTITKSKRNGKILIDYLRNQRGMTAVAPYSTRARPGAAVSMPIAWSELGAAIGPAYFTVKNTPTRLHALDADPWADFRAAAEPLKPEKKSKAKR